MINILENIIANPTFYNATQSTAAQMSVKTSLNAIGRPSFILVDKKIDPHTKKFSATKEFIYQMISLALYMAVIIPIFTNGGFTLAKIFSNENVFKAFKNPEKFKAFQKLSENEKVEKLKTLSHNYKQGRFVSWARKKLGKEVDTGVTFTRENINSESEYLAKGIIETSSLLGTVLGLAVLAPLTASKLIHPIMKFLKLNGNDKKAANTQNRN